MKNNFWSLKYDILNFLCNDIFMKTFWTNFLKFKGFGRLFFSFWATLVGQLFVTLNSKFCCSSFTREWSEGVEILTRMKSKEKEFSIFCLTFCHIFYQHFSSPNLVRPLSRPQGHFTIGFRVKTRLIWWDGMLYNKRPPLLSLHRFSGNAYHTHKMTNSKCLAFNYNHLILGPRAWDSP